MNIKTKSEYKKTLQKVETLMFASAQTEEGEELDALVLLIQAFEAEHYSLLT